MKRRVSSSNGSTNSSSGVGGSASGGSASPVGQQPTPIVQAPQIIATASPLGVSVVNNVVEQEVLETTVWLVDHSSYIFVRSRLKKKKIPFNCIFSFSSFYFLRLNSSMFCCVESFSLILLISKQTKNHHLYYF